MASEHRAFPDGDYERPEGILCGACGARIMEAVYTGGWMHAETEPHEFRGFVYGNGTPMNDSFCVGCGLLEGNALHVA